MNFWSIPERFLGLYTADEMAQANSGSSAAGNGVLRPFEPEQPRQLSLVTGAAVGDHPEHGGKPETPCGPAVPLPLQGFLQPDGSVGNRRNVEACFRFIEGELEQELGEAGRALFPTIHSRMPRVFKTKQACYVGTLACWLELWAEVERAKQQKEAA
jgi:hypothetical protein